MNWVSLPWRRQRGYTLIEILIALSIFAILATISSSTLYYAFNTKARVTEQADKLNNLQQAILLIERDTQQIQLRSVRGSDMTESSIFVGQPQKIEFTRAGYANPKAAEKQSILKRIGLLCQGNKLIRRTWTNLDGADQKAYRDLILINKLTTCEFSFFNQNLQTLNEWHPNAVQQNQRPEPLPMAIQMNLTLENWGNINYLFVIPEALYAEI